jgi:uncharacterized membrane protein
MSLLSGFWNPVKKYFLSGVLVVVPIILTFLVLRLLFNAVDSILQPIILHFWGISIPGLGIIATLTLILVVGIVTRNLIGSQVVEIWEGLMDKMPVIRPIYSASKQLLEAMTSAGAGSFKEVALVEYPRKGVYALGFVAQRVKLDIERAGVEMVTVFIPSTPTPMSGMVVFVPVDEVIWLDMTVEAGLSYVVSGGVAIPRSVATRAATVFPTGEGKS